MKYTIEQLKQMLAEAEKECNALGQTANNGYIYINTQLEFGHSCRYKSWENGNNDWCNFATPEQAKAFDERQMAIKRIWDWAKANDDFEPDWNDIDQKKYGISYEHEDKTLVWNESTFYQFQSELPYFSSVIKRIKCIEQNKQDLLTIFRIK